MPEASAWLLDTNILLRMTKNGDPHHAIIGEALRVLVSQGARLCFTSQILGEFWNASTRPRDQNGVRSECCGDGPHRARDRKGF